MKYSEKAKELLNRRAALLKIENEIKRVEEVVGAANAEREALLADPAALESGRKITKLGKLRDKAELGPGRVAMLRVQMADASASLGQLANDVHNETLLELVRIQGERREKFYDRIAPSFTNGRKNKHFHDDPHYGANIAKAKRWFAETDDFQSLESEKMRLAHAHPGHSQLPPAQRADVLLREIPALSEK